MNGSSSSNLINSLNELPPNFFKSPEQGTSVKDREIDTPEGPREITTIEKPLKNKNLGGLAIPEADLNVVNTKFSHYPKLYLVVHEDNHIRYENQFTADQRSDVGYYVNELTNRRISDEHYERLTGKHIDTAKDYEEMMKASFMSHGVSEEEAEYFIQFIRKDSDIDYLRIRGMPIDLQKEYSKYLKEEN
jgi:hypothetical protein